MSKISFEDIGNLMATFYAEEGVQDGQVVKMTGNGTVGPCGAGDLFCGVAGTPRAGIAGVQVGGFVKVPATMPLSVGMIGLVADGKGGVKTGENGTAVLVVDVDTAENTAVICL